MLYEMVFSYMAIGSAWMAVELWGGAAAALGRRCADEARAVPPHLIPLGAMLVALLVVFILSLVIIFWPYFVWDEWRKGELLKPGRWDDKE